jgi:hypothetical protein
MSRMDPRDLYGLPLERFTEERNAEAKRLRQDGRRDEAAEVAKLKKPSVAAWAVNQLVRTHPRDVDALLQAGDALQVAQADVVAGRGDARSLGAAAEAERAALETLTDTARGLLSSEGHELAPAKLEQVSETLHAAAIDPQARDQVRDGCLVRELRHVGLGALEGGAAPALRRTAARAKVPPDDGRAAERRAARQAEAAARREHERAVRALEVAQERRDRTADGLREAEHALSAARQRAERATEELERARDALEKR